MKIRLLIVVFAVFAIISCNMKSEKDIQIEKITKLENEAFPDSMKTLNKNKIFELMNAYEDFSTKFPTDTQAATYLFKAGEMAMNINIGGKAITYFTEIQDKFPNFKKLPESVFLTAFVYETQMNNKNKAKEFYTLFIQKFPNHFLVKDAKASLENIDIPIEELIKKWEQNNESKNDNLTAEKNKSKK